MSCVDVAQHPTPLASLHYDRLAGVYDRHWIERFTTGATSAVSTLLEPANVPNMRVLDVCCGAGHIAADLARQGCVVCGVDGSERLIEYAAARVPDARWFVSDVTEWLPTGPFDAAICTCDSINSIIDEGSLRRMLSNVGSAIVAGGVFVFDFNVPDAYESETYKHSEIVDGESAAVFKGRWDPDSRLGRTTVTAFVREGAWRRIDAELVHRCYEARELWTLLSQTGFSEISFWPAHSLGVSGETARGRWFARARRI
jgi:SAM-dependent methyltransferase